MTNEKDVGPDGLRVVCLIERVEDPPVLSQHRGIGQGDATGMSPSPSVAVRRASREMREPSVSWQKGWKGPAGDERDGRWRSGHGPSGQDPKDERRKEVS